MNILASLLPWGQVVLAVLLVTAILLQRSDEGLGSAFGGGNSGVFYQKRGLEKTLFTATIILAILFVLANLFTLFV